MSGFDRHPDARLLARFADGELDAESRRQVTAHVRSCAACSERVAFLEDLRAAAAGMPSPRPPDDLLGRILDRRAAGERVILPSEADVGLTASRPRIRPALVSGFVAALAIVGWLMLAPRATAGRSELLFDPVLPEPGEIVQVVYRPGLALADEDEVRLRLRWRAANSNPPRLGPLGELESAILVRSSRDEFLGEIRIPREAVFFAASVESMSGEVVDTRSGRLWDVLTRATDGRPTIESLLQKHRALELRSGLAALDALDTLTTLYPEEIRGWSSRLGAERRILAEEALDSRRPEHVDRFLAFYRAYATTGASDPSALEALISYARRLDDHETADRLQTELQARYPSHPLAVQHRLVEASRLRGNPAAWLEALEAEWQAYGPVTDQLLRDGVQAAIEFGDPGQVTTWAERYETSGHDPVWLARALEGVPSEADRRIALLTAEIGRLDTAEDADRRLTESRAAARRRLGGERRVVAGRLGLAYLDAGNDDEAIRWLQVAADDGWQPVLFGELAAALVERGELQRALPVIGYVAADPLTPPDSVEALRSLVESSGSVRWPDLYDASRVEFAGRIRSRATEGARLPVDLELVAEHGAPERLGDLLSGPISVLVMWDGFTVSDLPLVEKLNALAANPAATVVIVDIAPERPGTSRADAALEASTFRDRGSTLVEELDVFGKPYFFLVDPSGQVRYELAEIEDVDRVLEALEIEATPMA